MRYSVVEKIPKRNHIYNLVGINPIHVFLVKLDLRRVELDNHHDIVWVTKNCLPMFLFPWDDSKLWPSWTTGSW